MNTEKRESLQEFDPSCFFESFITTAKAIIIKPQHFFQNIPTEQPIRNPFLFLLVCSFLSSLFIANVSQGDFLWFSELFFSKIVAAFIGSFILHILLTKLFRSSMLFAATFRIMAYTSIMDIFFWIPFLGIVANFYSLYLMLIGIQNVHKLSQRQAVSAIMLIVLLITVMVVTAFIVAPDGMNQWTGMMNSTTEGMRSAR